MSKIIDFIAVYNAKFLREDATKEKISYVNMVLTRARELSRQKKKEA